MEGHRPPSVRQERKGLYPMPLRRQGAQSYPRHRESHSRLKGLTNLHRLRSRRLNKVNTAADAFLAREQRLEVLFNNAGVMVSPSEPNEPITVTAQGHELYLGVKCVATHLLTKPLTPTLIATEKISAHQDVGISTDNLDCHNPEKKTQRHSLSKTGAWTLGIEHNRHYRAQGVASVLIDPGNVVSGLPRDQALQLRIVAKLVFYPTVYGAYTALYAGFSPKVVSDQVDWTKEWVAPFGRIIRPDLTKATLLERDGRNAGTARFWNW
ncbi:uncharacterized protein PGRI_080670 [Penicillium griseofulvum]|uniref:Short-chain dehydrogenase/reductase SDR n=1 Tax=Penicillium patulum TaxID=5078 RepID=A0A135LV75_PENPA|nr:uncharacterized protein PGRI_080670 [Penicillium griseofulvum]KXG52811.1 hypothetical protein PGRI_080670 [Penicillium griseofulvum]